MASLSSCSAIVATEHNVKNKWIEALHFPNTHRNNDTLTVVSKSLAWQFILPFLVYHGPARVLKPLEYLNYDWSLHVLRETWTGKRHYGFCGEYANNRCKCCASQYLNKSGSVIDSSWEGGICVQCWTAGIITTVNTELLELTRGYARQH